MSNKNFMAYGDAETVLTGFANDIKTKASEAGTESLINSTVGWTGKNLLENRATSYISNTVEFTVYNDGSVKANGTATGGWAVLTLNASFSVKNGESYTISDSQNGGLIGGSNSTFRIWVESSSAFPFGNRLSTDSAEDMTRTALADENVTVIIQILQNITVENLMFYPMIRNAKIPSPTTYEPYHKSVEECLEDINDKLSYLEQTVTLSTSSSTTVTFTDSSITANSFIEYACSQWDLVPESITGAAGSCTIVLPKVDSAQSVTVRIYVR